MIIPNVLYCLLFEGTSKEAEAVIALRHWIGRIA
jgi:hypothetical protein